MTATPTTTMGWALEYAARGWLLLPIASSGDNQHAGSILGKRWQHKTSNDPDTLREWFGVGDHNMGIHLGPVSNVIDIEADTREGNAKADALVGHIITPAFSSSRSTHRLFRWDELGALGVRIEAAGDRIRFSPRSAVPAPLLEQMAAHKAEIMSLLQCQAEDAAEREAIRWADTPEAQPALEQAIREWEALVVPPIVRRDDRLDYIIANWDSLPLRVSTSTVFLKTREIGNTVDVDSVDASNCPRCLASKTVDIVLHHAPHNGRTIRRDCRQCGRFIEWSAWYGAGAVKPV